MKPKQKQKEILVTDAIQAIDDFLATGRDYYWSKSPEWVKEKILSLSTDGRITYNLAARALESASTPKCHGVANRGMVNIREQWRKHYIED